MDHPTDPAAALRELIELAAVSAEPARLQTISDVLHGALFELQKLRRAVDPRKLATETRRERMAAADERMKAAGTPDRIAAHMQQQGLSRSSVYRLLSHESQDTSAVASER